MCIVGAIHELYAVFTLPPIGGEITNQVYGYDSAEGLHFLFAQKMKQKMLSRPTVLRIPSCRRISVLLYSEDYYFTHVYSNRKWRADSLRQYLECDCFFGYASRLLLYFRLYCSLANEVLPKCSITFCSLEYWLSREFVHFDLWCTNGAPIGQLKYPLNFCIISGTGAASRCQSGN